MLHILKTNENCEDLSFLYKTEESEIIRLNGKDKLFPEACGLSLWIPSKRQTYFYNENLSQIAFHAGLSEEELLDENKISRVNLKRGVRLYAKRKDPEFALASVCTPESLNESFVMADKCARYLDALYIDGYRVIEGGLNLPYDYPAINACELSGTKACFAITSPEKFAKEDIIKQLEHDLVFKNYSGALFFVENEAQLKAAEKIRSTLASQLGFDIAAPKEIIGEVDSSLYRRLYLAQSKNIFDFETFCLQIDELSKNTQKEKLGICFSFMCADINKNTHKITYPKKAALLGLMKKYSIEQIFYDDSSALCFATGQTGEETHSLLFEDFRSFYAKCAYIKEKGIKNVLILSGEAEVEALSGVAGLL